MRQEFRVLRYDNYGRGFPDRPVVVYNNELYYCQLTELLQKLKVRTPVDLLGMSFGGILATDFAGHLPDLIKKVVLIDSGYRPLKPQGASPKSIAEYKELVNANERANGQVSDLNIRNATNSIRRRCRTFTLP